MAGAILAATMVTALVPTAARAASGFSGNVLVMDATSQPNNEWAKAKMWAQTQSFTTDMKVMDSDGNITVISPHRFELYQPDGADPVPWSYYSENVFIGKRVNADVSGALRALEELTGKQFVFVENLPADKVVDIEAWKARETQRLIEEAKRRAIEADPWIEIGLSEALEEADEVVAEQVTRVVTKYRVNLETKSIEPYETEETAVEERATGRKVERLKEGVVLDENTGKLYRPRTADDVTLSPSDIPEVQLPQYVLDRAPSGR